MLTLIPATLVQFCFNNTIYMKINFPFQLMGFKHDKNINSYEK